MWRPGLTDIRGSPVDTSKKIDVLLQHMEKEALQLRATMEELRKAEESFLEQTADPAELIVRAEKAERRAESAEFDLRVERQVYSSREDKCSERTRAAEAEVARLTSALQTSEAEVARLTLALKASLEVKGLKRRLLGQSRLLRGGNDEPSTPDAFRNSSP